MTADEKHLIARALHAASRHQLEQIADRVGVPRQSLRRVVDEHDLKLTAPWVLRRVAVALGVHGGAGTTTAGLICDPVRRAAKPCEGPNWIDRAKADRLGGAS